MTKKIIVIWLLLCCTAVKVFTQNFPELQFQHITANEGLSSNAVNCITEDKMGFIWIGTSNGLNRYDGYRFKKYYHNNANPNSLVSNGVQRLYCDSKNRLWICTEAGVSCFIPEQNRFINFSSKNKMPHYIKNNNSVGIYEDAAGSIWLCNQLEVIYKVLPGFSLQEVKINIPAFPFYYLLPLGYDNIFRDKAGTEWAFKANRIYKLNAATKQPEKTFQYPAVLKGQVLKMIQSSGGDYFIATWMSGVFQFNPGENSIKKITSLPVWVFTDMATWNYKNENWMACIHSNFGLYLLNKQNLTAKKYGFTAGDPSSIWGTDFNQCFIDKKGNLWLASYNGINKINAEQNTFDIIPVTEPGTTNYQTDKKGTVYSFFETGGSIWLSKRFVSTLEYDSAFQFKNYWNNLQNFSASANKSATATAYYFYKKQDDLYITTDSGLIVYNLLTKKTVSYFPSKPASVTNFRTMVPLNEDEIMIRSFDKGIYIFNSSTKKFSTHFSAGTCKNCLPVRINYLYRSKAGEIFISTSGEEKGLMKYQPANKIFVAVKPDNEEKFSMQASDLFGMNEDTAGNLWITSSAGLFVYNPKSNIIIEQKNDNEQIGGLSRICFDDYGNAWATASSGIWCYLSTQKKWISFNGEDGLPGTEFDGIIAKRKNGDIVAGLDGAVAVFHPKKLNDQSNVYAVVITEVFADTNNIPFALNNTAAKKLTIAPGQNSFTVDFAVLNYVSPAGARYYYRLAPLMSSFKLNDNGHINFTGLAPGQYTLHVRGGDKTGNIFDTEDVLEITVEPKWYQTNLFKIACLLISGLLIFYFVQRRIATIRTQAKLKQKIAETEMQALRAQMNPHFIFNSLNSIENFIMQNEKRLASDYLNKFARLIRMILDSSRNELVPIAKDMEALQLYIDLEQLRFNNKFSYKTIVEPALLTGEYRVPSLLIQPYVENAVVHGLAHSDKANLNLTVTASLQHETIKYMIQDNGIGRQQSKIYNIQNKPYHKSVGLTITEDRINNFNAANNIKDPIKFTDLFDADNKPCGTKVEIIIKAM